MDTHQSLFIVISLFGLVNVAIGRPTAVLVCGRPDQIDNGNLVVFGNKTIYNCGEGFQMLGDKSIECDGRNWQGTPPICAAPGCASLGFLPHGTILYKHDMKVAAFKCDENYDLDGPETIVCALSGWSKSMPTCKAKSSPILSKHQEELMGSDYSCITKSKAVNPPNEPFTRQSTEWVMAGGAPRLYTVYRCEWGYIPVGVSQNMYCKNGKWTGNGPQQCKFVGKFLHEKEEKKVETTKQDRSHEDWIHLSDYTCSSSEDKPVSPPKVEHSEFQIKVAITEGMPHMFVKYVCENGFKLRDENKFMYCINNKWMGHTPTCVSK